MKVKNIIKFVGLTTTHLLFVSLLVVGFFFEATHSVDVNNRTLVSTEFNILNINTIIITALCTTYALLLLPWILYFMRFDKKSGLQYFSVYPMTGKYIGKVVAVLLTALNLLTGITFYIIYIIYISNVGKYALHAESQLAVLTMLCCAIIFWGGTYLIYGSLYGVRRFKDIIKRKRERRKLRKQQNGY
ncbi:MAG: hypothetical protein IJY75_02845 [Bacteroidaceae bacterium]|nr:hypothetical protein [Bacteroidaceae bacterium]